ncbi:hypothetical protein [Antarcticimicrobium sediminis]|uniref:Uncharacterized protein n=1 Tax=Antarcticimicrobium sediminis TaxID=2546227 RepID=A0A4R5EZC1_9RHOB|nr:hypothetical protein [Antarcticimicrobium sediminis]TDE40167.1 hypothetical protein E1B25_04230 [Antarcticimicrobium sediminis]
MLKTTRRALRALTPSLGRTMTRFGLGSPGAPHPTTHQTDQTGQEQADHDQISLESVLDIPVRDMSGDSTAARAIQDRGQFLARQDRWDELACDIRAADRARTVAPGGVLRAELLAYGARCDVVSAVDHVLTEGAEAQDPALLSGVMALEAVRQEHRHDPYVNLVVAQAHTDIGWAWQGAGKAATLPALHRQRCAAHFDRAAHLLEPFDAITLDSPAIAAAQCALLVRRAEPASRLADRYGDLIDLDPTNYRAMRALGAYLLPRAGGALGTLELEARRTAARTQSIWGAGGYAWVSFDAIAQDSAACNQVDVGFFIDGLHDIVAARPGQEMINLLAAYCAVTLRRDKDAGAPDSPRARIAACASWLIRDHLTELHPLIWAHAAQGFDNNARVTSPQRFAARGRADALRAIADQFRDDLDRGLRIIFTPDGPITVNA